MPFVTFSSASPQWLMALRQRMHLGTLCGQMHELRQSHCGDNREGTFFSWSLVTFVLLLWNLKFENKWNIKSLMAFVLFLRCNPLPTRTCSYLMQCSYKTRSYSLKDYESVFLKRQNLVFSIVVESIFAFCFRLNIFK